MKKYFAKYLPVDGEIMEGDKYQDKGKLKLILTAHIPKNWNNPHTTYFDGYQKVKLFLCSRDIQVGDKFKHYYSGILTDKTCSEIKNGLIWTTESNAYGGRLKTDEWNIFKVIGEISPEAIWVKEGDEFYKEETALNGIWQNWDDTTPLSGRNIVKIKGPCGHYH